MVKRAFTIKATASRIERGLLAIPRKYSKEFPATKSTIRVVLDDGSRLEPKAYAPYEGKDRECRIFGLRGWFSRRRVVPGDVITVTVEDHTKGIYRVALDRYVRQRQESDARRELYRVDSPEAARLHLHRLAVATREKPQAVAFQEISRLAATRPLRRKRISMFQKGRAEAVPPSLRVLLEAIHGGRCQLCSFTFQKRDGSPYFEIHHVEADMGHHPANLLVVCANCHARLEQASVSKLERVLGWPVG